MVTDGKWKLIYIPHPVNSIYELYNIEKDPLETANLIDEEKGIGEKLKQKIILWMEKKDSEKKEEPEPYSGKDEKKVRERLKKLGYID